MIRNIFVLLLMLTNFLFAKDLAPLCKAELNFLGKMIAKKLCSNSFKLDVDSLIEGIQGNSSEPFISDDEYLYLITHLQEFLAGEKKNTDLRIADKFLQENKKKPDVIEIVPEKLQYKIVKEGNGLEVTPISRPLVKYKLVKLDGTIVSETKEPQPISLDDAILGFSKGLIGMKEQEVRVIYIHPDYGFKKDENQIDNSLLKIEVELLKSDYIPSIDNSLISKFNQEHLR